MRLSLRRRCPPSERERGFLLAELLAAAGVLLLAGAVAVQQGGSYLTVCRKAQVRTAAEILASDLRQLQQQAYFSVYVNRYLAVASDRRGYIWHRDGHMSRRSLESIGCGGVYFTAAVSARYNTSGGPANTAAFVLRHDGLASFQCRVYIEPVTGRVVTSESG